MKDSLAEFFRTLAERPAVLFLGQDALSMEGGSDPLLSEINRKFPGRATHGGKPYDAVFIRDGDTEREHYFDWIRERCRRIEVPAWKDTIGTVSWSSVFTSAIDTVIPHAFDVDWRELYRIYEEDIKPYDPRNRVTLHFTYLFGSVGRIEPKEQAPVTPLEFTRRKPIAGNLGRRIFESVTPLGMLIIEGYRPESDWLSSDQFYPILDNLGDRQIHFFSWADEKRPDEFIQELLHSGKAVLHSESLASVLQQGRDSGLLHAGQRTSEGDVRNSISVRNAVLSIPLDIRAQTSKSAQILDDSVLIDPPKISAEREYSDFREFLSNSSLRPNWVGFARGFAFGRDFESELHSKVEKALANAGNIKFPIILHGQTGTGKTVACGALAYAVKKEGKFPVLYIEKRTNRPNFRDISTFCEWAESNGAEATLIIWDGMIDFQQYSDLLKFLSSRGKKAIVVGTSYRLEDGVLRPDQSVEAKDTFGADELERLKAFIKKFDANFHAVNEAINRVESATFLVALYRLLPASRPRVQAGVLAEVGRETERILSTNQTDPIKTAYSSLAYALMQAGVATDESIRLDDMSEVEGEPTMRLEEVIGLIMVPGSFGLQVPLDILVRAFGVLNADQLVKTLGRSDIFRWVEDDVGNIFVAPRQALEAKILIRSWLGSPATEIAYAKKLLLEIRDSSMSHENLDINFGVDLLRSLGPNGPNKEAYRHHFKAISDVLRELRLDRGVINPRLMLQEAFFLREFIKESSVPIDEAVASLDEADGTLQDALLELPDEKRQNKLRSILLVERAATLGAKAVELSSGEVSATTFRGLYDEIRAVILEARSLDPDTFRPVDILFWTSTNMLDGDVLDSVTRSEVIAEIYNAIDSVNEGELNGSERRLFNEKKLRIGGLLGRVDIADDAFDALVSAGSTAGYYLRARGILGSVDITKPVETSSDLAAIADAYAYLDDYQAEISNDGKCLYLLLRLWWQFRSRFPIFFEECQTLPFSASDWRLALNLLEKLLQSGEYYRRPGLLYLQAVAYFHLDNIEQANSLFREISFEPEESQGRRRIIRSYLASNSNGTPREFSGSVTWTSGVKGEVFVEELGRNVPFFSYDFGRPDIKRGDALGKFHIAFNFIGMIADPVRFQRRNR